MTKTVITHCVTHGEPDAWKLARPVRREGSGNLSLKGDKALYPYSTRELIAQKYDGSQNRTSPGRPQIGQEIVNLVIRFKEENPRWGYQKITDQIVYLGHKISKSSVKNILIENGYDPEPDLTVRSTWHEFIKSHWDVLAACDFFTIELLVGRKLVRCTVFFVIELATRKVFFAPVKPQPDGAYMKQVAKILTDLEDGFLHGKRYLIHDRDPLYTTCLLYTSPSPRD